ncbi:hypothetical protein EZV62_025256 [Acer yangbiense]|uniref:Peptidase metallopeptidase domain-containing protein n=1 Tax=Acer yangbiense TaxID=1000413 RepID=A0A5C7GXR9_9ROSI|nr:hypothetical protein EZV62_025256 [Acer yangbiense]
MELDEIDLNAPDFGSSILLKKIPNNNVFEASHAGDVDRLRFLLNSSLVNVNTRDRWDSVVLYYAYLASVNTRSALNLKVRKLLKAFEARSPPLLGPLENVQKIDHNNTGIKDLKKYLQKFGYLKNYDNVPAGLEDAHDNDLLAAIKLYQQSFRLNVTGILDSDTVTQMMKPRCGVPDHVMIKPKNHGHQDDKGKSFHTVAHYQFIPGNPRWSNKQLTYTFISTAQVPDDLNVRSAFKSAFQSWAQVTDFSFEEVADGSNDADIVIGFHRRDHGDREPFDGFQGVLAHSLPPTAGTSHYDADEKWSSNSNPGLDELDLESVALHEIGHVLGLGHETGLREAVMYPSISYGQTKRDLNDDDIQGIQTLYNLS